MWKAKWNQLFIFSSYRTISHCFLFSCYIGYNFPSLSSVICFLFFTYCKFFFICQSFCLYFIRTMNGDIELSSENIFDCDNISASTGLLSWRAVLKYLGAMVFFILPCSPLTGIIVSTVVVGIIRNFRVFLVSVVWALLLTAFLGLPRPAAGLMASVKPKMYAKFYCSRTVR